MTYRYATSINGMPRQEIDAMTLEEAKQKAMASIDKSKLRRDRTWHIKIYRDDNGQWTELTRFTHRHFFRAASGF